MNYKSSNPVQSHTLLKMAEKGKQGEINPIIESLMKDCDPVLN